MSAHLVLVPFEARLAGTIASWARTAEERDQWASASVADQDAFARWHADPGVHPFVLSSAGELLAYGEVGEDRDEHEVELTRLIVQPAMRGAGVGRALVRLLTAEAYARGFPVVWVRVVPANAAAIACYRAADFVRTSCDDEERFNRGQPRNYVWMKHLRSR